MYLSSVTIRYKYSNNKKAVTVNYNIKSPTSPAGTKVSGRLTKKQFTVYGMNTYKYINKYGKAPNHVSIKIGKIQFQTFIYSNSKILAWSVNNGGKLPTSLTLKIAAGNSINKYMPKYQESSGSSGINSINPNPPSTVKSVSMTSIFEASNRVKNYVEKK